MSDKNAYILGNQFWPIFRRLQTLPPALSSIVVPKVLHSPLVSGIVMNYHPTPIDVSLPYVVIDGRLMVNVFTHSVISAHELPEQYFSVGSILIVQEAAGITAEQAKLWSEKYQIHVVLIVTDQTVSNHIDTYRFGLSWGSHNRVNAEIVRDKTNLFAELRSYL